MSRAKDLSLPQVTFYTKAGCHLCDEARDMLDDIAAETAFELIETDIRTSAELFEQYRYRIPVIIIDDTLIVEERIEYRDLVHAFQEASQRRK